MNKTSIFILAELVKAMRSRTPRVHGISVLDTDRDTFQIAVEFFLNAPPEAIELAKVVTNLNEISRIDFEELDGGEHSVAFIQELLTKDEIVEAFDLANQFDVERNAAIHERMTRLLGSDHA